MTRKTWGMIVMAALILGVVWYAKHSTCPTCQQKTAAVKLAFTQWRRRFGMRIIE